MKNSVDIISPTYLLALRFTIAAIALILVFWRKVMKINKSVYSAGGLLGVFLFVSYFFQTYGLKYTTASKNAFITTLYVILVPFLHWFFNTKKPKRNNVIAACMGLWALRFCRWKGLSINLGDLLTLICGFFYAVHIVFIDRYTTDTTGHDDGAADGGGCGPELDYRADSGRGPFDGGVIDNTMMIGLFYLGIFSTMIGFLHQNVGQKYLTPNTSSILLSFESVFGLIFSVIFLGDPLTVRLMAGCVFMFAAVILFEYRKKKRHLKMKWEKEN